MKKIFLNKKGVESLIAWVLLIGFSVALAVFVTRWSLQQAQKSTEGVEEMIMGDIQCNDVAISGYCERTDVKIKNRGTLNIIGFKLSNKDNPTMFENNPLRPNADYPTRIDARTKISITPIIKIDDKKVYCTTQKQDFECR